MRTRLRRFLSHLSTVSRSWWRALRLFFGMSRRTILLQLALMGLIGLVPALQIQLTRMLVQTVQAAIFSKGRPEVVWAAIFLGLAQAALVMASALLSSWQGYLQQLLQFQLTTRVSLLVMEKTMELDIQHFEDDQLYDQLQRASQESLSRPASFMTQMLAVLSQTVSIVSVAAVLFSWNVFIGLVLLLSLLPSLGAQLFFAQKDYRVARERTRDLRRLLYLQKLVTTVQSIKEVLLFRLAPLFLRRYRERFETFYRVDRALVRQRTALTATLDLLTSGISSGTQIYAILLAIATGNLGLLAGYVQAIGTVQGSTKGLLTSLSELYHQNLFVSNLFEFLDISSSQPRSGTRRFPTSLRKGIVFSHVSFRYPGTTRLILHDISFCCRAGECVALVGKNGAGKTTIVKLLTRLYEPTEGQIFIDDVPIEDYDLQELRAQIGVIFQDFVQYEMPVRDNIGFGQLEALSDLDQIQHAARASGAAAFVERLPQSYETILGRTFEKGEQLSIGQWQKIALSRAFIGQAPIVVLDEPTASIDAEAEAEIFACLREVARGASTLLIAHRFSTVRLADRILVLSEGRISEEGSHQSLMNAQGLYAHLFSLQAAGYMV